MAADGRTYQVWGNRGYNATVYLYKAPQADTSLRRFDYDGVLFSGGYAPPQFCHAYGPFAPGTDPLLHCDHAYQAWATECPDFMHMPGGHLLIASLGLGGYDNLPVRPSVSRSLVVTCRTYGVHTL